MVNHSEKKKNHHHHHHHHQVSGNKYKSVSRDVPSQNLGMKYQLYPRSIPNIIHQYFACEPKIHYYMFFLSLWKNLRSINVSFQIYPRFVGWTTQLFKVLDLKQTVFTYLPPIEKPITSYEEIEMFTSSEQLSKQVNIKYSHHFGCWCSNQGISCAVESTRKLV